MSHDGVAYRSSDDAPFFIFSCGRSGSSLLSRMLDQHPRLGVPFESHLFNTFYPLLKYYRDLNDRRNVERLVCDILSTDVLHDWSPRPDAERILGCIHVGSFGGVMEGLLRAWLDINGKQRWGEKTPRHVFYWREILHFFPQAKFVHMIRDGRDVALSWMRARFGPKTVYPAARQWIRYLQEIDEIRHSKHNEVLLEIRYEDLLDDPEGTLRGLCRFLGEDYVPGMLDFHRNESPYRTDSTNLENLRRPLMTENQQKWRTQMSQGQRRVFEAVAAPMLRHYKYETSPQRPRLLPGEAFCRRSLAGPFPKVIAMASNRKGHIDGWIRLKLLARLMLIDPIRRRSA